MAGRYVWNRLFIIFALAVFILAILLYFIRYFSHKELDDISPEISCSDELIEKSDILWVVPYFNDRPIGENREWCDYILSFNKTLGLHGVYHIYNEFSIYRNENYLEKGIVEFERCFGHKPEIFKSPQLALSWENREIIEKGGFSVYGKISQMTHRVYHCSDTGKFPNKLIDWF